MRSVLLTSIDVPPPSATAADILARADTRAVEPARQHVPPRVRRRLVGAGVLVVAVVASIIVFPWRAGYAAPMMLDLPTTSDEPAARWLDQLLINIDKSPPDQSSGDGSTFLHYQDWDMESPPGLEIIAKDVRTWWRPDLSGAIVTTDVVQPSGSRLATLETSLEQPRNEQNFGPGQYDTLVDLPSTDPQRLTQQITGHEPLENGPQSVLRALAAFSTRHKLGRSQRVAMVKVLKNVPGLSYYGTVTDRANRTGMAFGVDSPSDPVSGQTRDILVLDQHANILSHEIVSLISPSKVQLPAFAVVAYTLFL